MKPALLTLLLLLTGCGETWQEAVARDHERLWQDLDVCRYEAREKKTNKLLCRAGDCYCHKRLVEDTLGHGGHTFFEEKQ